MKIYYEVLPPTLGRAMYRIRTELSRRAPQGITFAANLAEADLQILDVIGEGSLAYLGDKPYVILQHCLGTSGIGENALRSLWDGAKAVFSPLALSGGQDVRRMPWGVDCGLFYRDSTPAVLGLGRADVLTTGYCAQGEAIRECWAAASKSIHVGNLQEVPPDAVEQYEDISDEMLRRLYSDVRYVSGLRRMEGFELPVLEGLACGARPVCFDLECYRHWFSGHAVFVDHALPQVDLVEQLRAIFRTAPKPVTEDEREWLCERFSWDKIAAAFWEAAL